MQTLISFFPHQNNNDKQSGSPVQLFLPQKAVFKVRKGRGDDSSFPLANLQRVQTSLSARSHLVFSDHLYLTSVNNSPPLASIPTKITIKLPLVAGYN